MREKHGAVKKGEPSYLVFSQEEKEKLIKELGIQKNNNEATNPTTAKQNNGTLDYPPEATDMNQKMNPEELANIAESL